MSTPTPTPWRCEGGGLGMNMTGYSENPNPVKPSSEAQRRGEARRKIELMRDAQALGEQLLDPWEDN